MAQNIRIIGARTHNLKNISLELPRNKMIVFTGISGSGKSSLAFDTIFAEGQRRYVESLSSYARQFLRKLSKPDVDEIEGLSPAISIDQHARSGNPRSTVATITEIYDYLRVLFARIGKPHCLVCREKIEKLSVDEIVNLVTHKLKGKLRILAPLIRGRKGEYYQLLYDLLGKGYQEVEIDGKMYKLRERIVLDKNRHHEINVLIDEADSQDRIDEAVSKALEESGGLVKINDSLFSTSFTCPKDGFSFMEIEPRLFSFNSPYGACEACHGLGTKYFMGEEKCEECQGKRLRKESLHVFIGSKNIVDISNLTIKEAAHFFSNLRMPQRDNNISALILKEIEARLKFMLDVGLDYLALDRKAGTLSGGESQRIRLASQLGSSLVGALYVLDEPTIGLHPKDTEKLLQTLHTLRDLGNTIIVVEHDEDTILASDYLVDIGKGAGVHGGAVMAAGDVDKLVDSKIKKSDSLTLNYLNGHSAIVSPQKRRSKEKGTLKIRGANIFNIKNLNLDIPLGRLIALTGVSGSGKSTLMHEIIHKNLQSRELANCKHFLGKEYLSRSFLIDQSPIGRTPRSNPATYSGAFTHIRDLFSSTADARLKGYRPGRFSFNVPGGRCETCEGNGSMAVEMHFLPTVYVTCDVCRGKRFAKETLEIKYKKKNIYDILCLTIEEGLKFFSDIPAIADRLKTLEDVGLGYLKLGQSATTLSGGESQRVKIASELYRPFAEKTFYLLDEPSIGLHYEDIKKLLEVLNKLVDQGNSVMVIEHNMDIIKSADYVIDIGPDGGEAGGKIVAAGAPEEVAEDRNSHTAKYLKRVFTNEKKSHSKIQTAK